ncbi:hypothetical protein [Brevundimonas sp. M20]|nr:hypothetical protein [Brevundimonas sp. M20]
MAMLIRKRVVLTVIFSAESGYEAEKWQKDAVTCRERRREIPA